MKILSIQKLFSGNYLRKSLLFFPENRRLKVRQFPALRECKIIELDVSGMILLQDVDTNVPEAGNYFPLLHVQLVSTSL